MRVAPRIVHSDDHCRLAVWQNVSIADIAGSIDALRMRRITRMHKELGIAFPNGVAALTVLRPGVPMGSSEGRDEAVKGLKEIGDLLLRSALVIEDTGVMAQVLRTFVRGLNVITRNTKIVLCSRIDEAVVSLSPLVVPPQPDTDVRAQLAAAVAEIRKDYAPQPAQQFAQR